MKKILAIVILSLSAITLAAQSVITTVTTDFKVNGATMTDYHHFKVGDTVTVYGFKKKSDKYHFIVEAKDYANLFSIDFIPFAAEEKQLKQLPNALDSDMSAFIAQKKQEIENKKAKERKEQALSGKIRVVMRDHYTLYASDDAKGSVEKGDTIYILGYKNGGYTQYYALYSNKAAGVFKGISRDNIFERDININYLPSTDDPDVKAAISKKQQELVQKKADEAARYRQNALNGNVKGILYLGELRTDDYKSRPFKSGDTLSIVGYSKKDYKEYFAVYSKKGAGVYQSTYSYDMTFKNKADIDLSKLPSTTDPEVLAVLERQQLVSDSLMAIEEAQAYEEYKNSANTLIGIYKQADPIIVTVEGWNSNSVGGIEVNLSVINCSLQTIKYITFKGYFTNAVGDKCRNEIGGGTTWTGRGVGPIGPRPTGTDNFEVEHAECHANYDFDQLTFYSRIAQYFHLSSVTIQYMKGKTVTLSGNKLKKHVIYK